LQAQEKTGVKIMKVSRNSRLAGLAVLSLSMLQACSAADPDSEAGQGEAASSGGDAKQAAGDKEGFKPGESLAYEWSAAGFEQLPSDYKWSGSARRDEGFEPNFSLSVPETDDVIWSSECAAGGKIRSHVLFSPPKSMKNNRVTFKFETDKSTKTLEYDAKYVPTGQFDGFEIVQSANDRMFAEMKSASWAYMQMGDGDDAVKLRISLANASKALNTFLPACTAPQKPAATAMSTQVRYSCDDGRTIRASYLGNDTDTPVVRLEIGDELVILPQAVSGSGLRYENSGNMKADRRRAWLSKGSEAFLVESDGADGANEVSLLCRETG
jgi:membrane-bound inhibitor of C-type lysozyme